MFNEMLNTLQMQNLIIYFSSAWVWWLFPIPAVIYYFIPAYKLHTEYVEIAHLTELTTKETQYQRRNSQRKIKWIYVLVGIIWLGLLASASRPEQLILGEQKEVSVRDMLLVLDISGSMAIRDMQDENGEPASASRMQVMQQAVTEFIKKRSYDNIGLIVFGSQALPITPVSQDHNALLEQVNEMVPGMAGAQTSIGDAMGVAIRSFKNMDRKNMNRGIVENDSTHVNKERTVILLTDGLDTSSVLPPRVALRLAEKQHITFHTIAFGDVSGESSNASIDVKLLQDIAQQTKGSFHQASESLASLQQVYDAIDKLTPRKMTLTASTHRVPLFAYPLFLSLLITVVMLVLSLQHRSSHD